MTTLRVLDRQGHLVLIEAAPGLTGWMPASGLSRPCGDCGNRTWSVGVVQGPPRYWRLFCAACCKLRRGEKVVRTVEV